MNDGSPPGMGGAPSCSVPSAQEHGDAAGRRGGVQFDPRRLRVRRYVEHQHARSRRGDGPPRREGESQVAGRHLGYVVADVSGSGTYRAGRSGVRAVVPAGQFTTRLPRRTRVQVAEAAQRVDGLERDVVGDPPDGADQGKQFGPAVANGSGGGVGRCSCVSSWLRKWGPRDRSERELRAVPLVYVGSSLTN
jgi:hypothetical protein